MSREQEQALSPAQREEAARRLLPEALALAARYRRRTRGDADSAALVGLAQALATWEPARGNLRSWAYRRVHHALQHDQRDHSGLPRWRYEEIGHGAEPLARELLPLTLDHWVGDMDDTFAAMVASDEDLESTVLDEWEREAFCGIVLGLPEPARGTLLAIYWGERTYRQIAEQHGAHPNKATTWRLTGLRILRKSPELLALLASAARREGER
jgi:RNA polymerase sigma factor (sigma-70 family)